MFVIIGFVVVIAGVLLGYTLHEGQILLLWQPTEFLIIGGAALGGMLIANPLPTTMGIIKGILGSFKGASTTKEAYLDLLKLLYELFQLAKRDGLIALEPHVSMALQIVGYGSMALQIVGYGTRSTRSILRIGG